jgi:hypothetical protein
VNTYDPRDDIVYLHLHLDAGRDTPSGSMACVNGIDRLPSGYANGSPRTYLRSPRRINSAAWARRTPPRSPLATRVHPSVLPGQTAM